MVKEPKRWTVTKAISEAAELGVQLSRPTVIKMCRDFAVGYQPTGPGGKWAIRPDRFMAIIRGGQFKWDLT